MADRSFDKPELSVLPETVISESSFRRRYLLKLLAMPSSLVPMILGVTDLLALWTFNIRSGMAVFAGLAGVLGGLGLFVTRFLTGHDKIAGSVIASLREETVHQRERALNDLDHRLCQDDDPRPEKLLRDLRTLAQMIEPEKANAGSLATASAIDILGGVDRLFKECVLSLEKTWELRNSADLMTQAALKKPILKQREQIIGEVSESIGHLGKIIADIKALERENHGSTVSDLSTIRSELDQSLSVAKKVSERMASLDQMIEGDKI